MKTKLTLTVAALLLIAMLLVNLVLAVLWQRDALQREAERDQAALAHLQCRLADANGALPQANRQLSFASFYPGGKNGQLAVCLPNCKPAVSNDAMLTAVVAAAMAGHPASRSSSSPADMLRGLQPALASAQPIVRQGKVIGAVAVVRPLESVLQPLWRTERIVLGYVVFNVLALGAIFFFRLSSLIVRPIERLIHLAGQCAQETVWFAADDSGSEFRLLAGSLNSMLAQIKQDRKSLHATVAELEAANRQLREQQQEMIRAEKLASVGRMAAGLAHEIGNPLGIMQGYLGLLARKAQNDEQQDFIRRTDQELQRVSSLVRQLLDCARTAKGRPELFSVHALLQSVVDMARMQPAFRQIELTIEAAAERDMVYADQDQLRQVVLNCLLNSADAIRSAERPDGAIALATDMPTPQLLRIRLADNGIGIAKEQLALVFDPFYTTKEPGKGTGLGLSVSRSIVENAGGSMTLESTAGEGSTVFVRLPLAEGGGKKC